MNDDHLEHDSHAAPRCGSLPPAPPGWRSVPAPQKPHRATGRPSRRPRAPSSRRCRGLTACGRRSRSQAPSARAGTGPCLQRFRGTAFPSERCRTSSAGSRSPCCARAARRPVIARRSTSWRSRACSSAWTRASTIRSTPTSTSSRSSAPPALGRGAGDSKGTISRGTSPSSAGPSSPSRSSSAPGRPAPGAPIARSRRATGRWRGRKTQRGRSCSRSTAGCGGRSCSRRSR